MPIRLNKIVCPKLLSNCLTRLSRWLIVDIASGLSIVCLTTAKKEETRQMATIIRQRLEAYEVEIPETLNGFRDWEFSSGSTMGKDFKVFARLFKRYIKSQIPEGTELLKFSLNHYETSGFISKANRFIYFSIPDVRFFPGEWYNRILIRTAKSEQDYTGGTNNYTSLADFRKNAERLLMETG